MYQIKNLVDFSPQKLNNIEIIRQVFPVGFNMLMDLPNTYKPLVEEFTGHQIIEYGEKKKEWMSDLPYEQYSHSMILKDFYGDILIGGLGLGVFFEYINNYNRIDIVEKNQNIIDLVWPYFRGKRNVHIYCCDLIDYTPSKYDFLYIDFSCSSYRDKVLERELYTKKFSLFINNIRFWEL